MPGIDSSANLQPTLTRREPAYPEVKAFPFSPELAVVGDSQPGKQTERKSLSQASFASDTEIPVSRKQLLIILSFAGAVLLLAILTLARPAFQKPPKEARAGWNRDGIKASYVAAQLREVDKAHSSLILSYDLSNQTDLDYHLTDGAGVLIMSRLKADGSLSQEESIHLSYPVFLPARQRARLAIEISGAFPWPREDSHYEERLKEFVKQRLSEVRGFVLFDEASHSQIDLPAAWPELQDRTQAGG
jgi:hypothetical protein